jgi:hypothetical protein
MAGVMMGRTSLDRRLGDDEETSLELSSSARAVAAAAVEIRCSAAAAMTLRFVDFGSDMSRWSLKGNNVSDNKKCVLHKKWITQNNFTTDASLW